MIAVIFDTETTGLPEAGKQPQIIELGAIKVNTKTGKQLAELSQLLYPDCPVPEEITEMTGIQDDDLEGQPRFAQFLPELKAFFSGTDMLVAHNAEFDTTMLKLELARVGCEDFPWPRLTMCTAVEFTVLMGFRPKLVKAYEYFTGNPLQQTHRALDDCRALLECCEKSSLLRLL